MEVPDIEEVPLELNEDDILDKKKSPPEKKKRVLTEAQKEGLAKGRAKMKAIRDAKKREEIEKELSKERKKEDAKKKRELKKKEAEGLKLQQVEKTTQKKEKKEKQSKQEETLARINARNRQKQIDEFHSLKYKCLESLPDETTFKALDNVLTKSITEEDICGDRHKLRQKVAKLIVDVRKKYS
jgi:hypothetical protein